MAVAQLLLLAALLLCPSSAVPACPESCSCQSPDQLNCSSSDLTLVPKPIPDSVAELDLSDNHLDSVTLDRPHYNLRNIWLGNNSITHLTLCIERGLGSQDVTSRRLLQQRPWQRRGCVSWAPALQLLSVERNQLDQLPEGLAGCRSLQVLQLSFNRISTIRSQQLSHLQQLKELHLRHNLITSLHPQTFKDLTQLKVLDLSFNMLTSLHPLTYLSLHNIGTDVWFAGNRLDHHQNVTVFSGSEIWLSCSTQGLTPSGQASVSQPGSGLLTKDIKETDTGLYVCVSGEQEVASVFNLQISKVGSTHRKARSLPENSHQIISHGRVEQERNTRTTQSDLALAVCLSILFTFLVAFVLGVLARPCVDRLWKRVSKKKSSTVTNTVSTVEQSQYDNGAYCNVEELGVIGNHRERRVTFSTVDYREDTNVQYYDTVASGDQESINNDSVFECEAAVAGRERVRDSGSEGRSSPEDNQRDGRALSTATVVEITEKRRHSSSSSDSSLSDKENNEKQVAKQDITRSKSPQLAEESIQQRASISTVPHTSIESTDVSLGFSSEPFAGWSPHADQWQENEEQFEFSDSIRSNSPRSSSVLGAFDHPQLTHKQKRGDTSSSSSCLSENEITHYTVNSEKDEEEDASRLSLGFNHSETGTKKAHSSSCTSSDSDEEGHKVTQAIGIGVVKVESDKLSSSVVTAELDNKEKVKPVPPRRTNVPSSTVDIQGKRVKPRAPPPPTHHSSSSSSESEAEDKYLHVENKQGQTEMSEVQLQKIQTSSNVVGTQRPSEGDQWPVLNLDQTTRLKRRLDIKAKTPTSSSSSSSDSDDKTSVSVKEKPGRLHITNQSQTIPTPCSDSSSSSDSEDEAIKKEVQGQMQVARPHEPEPQWPSLDLEKTTKIKRRLDIKAQLPASGSSSSSESEDETRVSIKRPTLATQTVPQMHPDSSSSSDSEDYTFTEPIRKEQGQLHTVKLPHQDSQTGSIDQESGWPVLNLGKGMRIKRRLDIKVKVPASESSSSSDSDEEVRVSIKRPGKVETANLGIQGSETVSKSHYDSSSSSDSEEEAIKPMKKQDLGQLHITAPSPKESIDQKSDWPVINLEKTLRVKRRLDIKPQLPASGSSSSSESEDETRVSIKRPTLATQTVPQMHPDSSSSSDSEDYTFSEPIRKEQGQLHTVKLPHQDAQTGSIDQESGWPVLNLGKRMRIKRRLDIKVKVPASESSSSSSDSDEEVRVSIKRPGKVETANLGIQGSETVSKSESDSSSSSDSEEEAIKPMKKQDLGQLHITAPSFKESIDQKSGWPVINLEKTLRIKRRLDIKAQLPASGSSSSSESEDETRVSIKRPTLATQTVPQMHPDSSSSSDSEDYTFTEPIRKEQGQLHTVKLQHQDSQTGSIDQESGWPVLNLGKGMRIKRRLDIKVKVPASESSSSSDSDEEVRLSIKRPGKVETANLGIQGSETVSKSQSDSSSSSDSEDEAIKPMNKQDLGQLHMGRPPLHKSQTSGHAPPTQWPLLDFEHTTSVKRRLDIKVQSRASDSSSSSESEDETTNSLKRPKSVDISKVVIQKPQTVPKSQSNSSSSSDNEDESNKPIKKQGLGQLNISKVTHDKYPTNDYQDQESGWPVLNFEHLPRVKRRLDIKTHFKVSDSSSSDSEDDTRISKVKSGRLDKTNLSIQKSQLVPLDNSSSSSSSDSEEDEDKKVLKKQEQEKMHVTGLPLVTSQTNVPQSQWPLLDLERTTSIKRRLDIKVRSEVSDSSSDRDNEDRIASSIKGPGKVYLENQKPQSVPISHSDSSSSSDSEDDSTIPMKKQEQGQLLVTRHPLDKYPPVGQESDWPVINLENLPRPKRHLDIKRQVKASESSTSSGSEDETRISVKRPDSLNTAILITQKSQTVPTHHSDSSSSSDSDNESPEPITKQVLEQRQFTGTSLEKPLTSGHVTQPQWPLLDFEHTTSIKRRLDFKVKSQTSGSLSSGDSGDDKNNSLKGPIKVDQAIHKPKTVPALHPDSSSSSDSDDDSINLRKKQEKVNLKTERLPLKESQTVGQGLESDWPVLNLDHIPQVKRRLDIKAKKAASESSSSSDSEDETTISKHGPGRLEITNLANQKPQTVPTPASDSSSSSDSEDEAIKPMNKQDLGQLHMGRPSLDKSQTSGHAPPTQWPLLDFEHTTSVKRRLDIKVQSRASDSSSSSESENETTNSLKRPKSVDISEVLIQKPQTVPKSQSNSSSSSDSEDESNKPIKKQGLGLLHTAKPPLKDSIDHKSGWPVLKLEKRFGVKRRLDIKAQIPASESSSSSDSEDENTNSIKRPGKVGITKLATRITTVPTLHSDSSSSSYSEDEATKATQKQEQGKFDTARPSQWPLLDLEHTTSIKRRLDFKPQPPLIDFSSSSDSEEEARNEFKKQAEHQIQTFPNSSLKWQKMDSSTGVDIRPHSPTHESSSSSDESTGNSGNQPGSALPDVGMSISYKPHLNLKSPSYLEANPVLGPVTPGSQLSESSSSTSESEDENKDYRKLQLGPTDHKTTEKEHIQSPTSPVIHIPLSPKTDPNITLEKYKVITHESISTTPEISPELQLRWATMNLGISRFRKRLDVTPRAHGPPKVPSSPLPDTSSSSSESDNEGESGKTKRQKGGIEKQIIKNTELLTKSEIPPVTVSPSLKGRNDSFGTVELKERQERQIQRDASSSSNSENDTTDHPVLDLSRGIPRVKKRLNVIAPLPEPGNSSSSSSSSDTETKGHSVKQSRPVLTTPQYRDTDTLITYKRSIFQTTSPTSSPPSFNDLSFYDTKQRYSEITHQSPPHGSKDSKPSIATKKFPSFDDMIKKMVGQSKRTTELPPELKWTGVGRQMPDMPNLSPESRLGVGYSRPPAEPELPPPDSSSSSSSESDDEIKQDRVNPDVTLTHEYSSLSGVTVSSASARTLTTDDNSSIRTDEIWKGISEEKRERKGLSALKAMSSLRHQWDTTDGQFDNSTSVFDDFGPSVKTNLSYSRSEEPIRPLATQSLRQVPLYLSSASVDERKATGVSYEIPSYRRHDFGDMVPPQETPPPIPTTPPPSDEALGLTWRSRQNSWKQRSEGTRYYVTQSGYTTGTNSTSLTSENLKDLLDSSKSPITEV
ncbi:uncharacterized protein LOC122877756 isoform X1 [Xyrichtys novacula]|uniref:Uncharacterized protein LOC122877756 isoform X1 n=1 Tax=Xyrichtys novacula TaxID=13765 RepID=A0AAV1FHY7_XYRNO|nr:uncharacterized protein LOC122877756 isoform X1 [Xyrichtys novacula]